MQRFQSVLQQEMGVGHLLTDDVIPIAYLTGHQEALAVHVFKRAFRHVGDAVLRRDSKEQPLRPAGMTGQAVILQLMIEDDHLINALVQPMQQLLFRAQLGGDGHVRVEGG